MFKLIATMRRGSSKWIATLFRDDRILRADDRPGRRSAGVCGVGGTVRHAGQTAAEETEVLLQDGLRSGRPVMIPGAFEARAGQFTRVGRGGLGIAPPTPRRDRVPYRGDRCSRGSGATSRARPTRRHSLPCAVSRSWPWRARSIFSNGRHRAAVNHIFRSGDGGGAR